MKSPAPLCIWLRRGILCGGLILLVLCATLYFWSAAIIEAVLSPKLEARGGDLAVESVRIDLHGIEIKLAHYEEDNLTIRGLLVVSQWSQLWIFRDGFAGRLQFEEVLLRMPVQMVPEADSDRPKPAALAKIWAGVMSSLPFRNVEVVINNLRIQTPERRFHYTAAMSFLRGKDGEAHLAAELLGRGLDLDLRVKILEGGGGLAADFVGVASDWEAFLAAYLPNLSEWLAGDPMELYLNPLPEGSGFLDLSAYARWHGSQPEQLRATVLADLGPGEVYFPNGELVAEKISIGSTINGQGLVRVFAKGGIDSVRSGTWMRNGGDWALRLDGDSLSAELRLGNELALSLWHEDWHELFAGSGALRFHLEANSVDAALLGLLPLEGVPDDLQVKAELQLEGRGQIKDYQLESASVQGMAAVSEVVWDSKGLTLRDLQAEANLSLSQVGLRLGSLDLVLSELEMLGLKLGDLQFAARATKTGAFVVDPIRADFMSGTLRIKGMKIDPNHLDNVVLRADIEAVELPQLSAAVPQFQGEITGTASGYLIGAWRGGRVVLTDGRLEVDAASSARLQYDVKGLLTRGMREGSAAYKQYRMAEKAFADLALKQFQIEVFPEGQATRPFRLELFGESEQNGMVVPVDFDLNVNVDDTAGLLEILQLMRRGELDLN